jgi:hypothetical protein
MLRVSHGLVTRRHPLYISRSAPAATVTLLLAILLTLNPKTRSKYTAYTVDLSSLPLTYKNNDILLDAKLSRHMTQLRQINTNLRRSY